MREVEVCFEVEEPLLNEGIIQELFRLLDESDLPLGIPEGDLSIAFVDRERICQVHDEFFQDPTVTDVITFPGDVEDAFAGEVIICPPYAHEVSEKLGEPLFKELTLYLIHGWLHLAGLDDIEEDDRQAMRAAEQTVMNYLDQADFFRSRL